MAIKPLVNIDLTPEACLELVIKFFNSRKSHKKSYKDARGVVRKDANPILITDLANYLGISVHQLKQLRFVPSYSKTITYAFQLMESDIVTGGMRGYFHPLLAIFYLKNYFGFQDRVSLDIDIQNRELSNNQYEIANKLDSVLQFDITEAVNVQICSNNVTRETDGEQVGNFAPVPKVETLDDVIDKAFAKLNGVMLEPDEVEQESEPEPPKPPKKKVRRKIGRVKS